MTYDEASHEAILFGGRGSGGLLADTWVWDGESWRSLHPSAAPPAREGAAMAYDPASHQVILFGGRDTIGVLFDTWTWDGSTWMRQDPAHSPAPGAAGMVYDPATNKLLLFSNVGTSQTDRVAACTATTWTLTGQTWARLTPSVNANVYGLLCRGC